MAADRKQQLIAAIHEHSAYLRRFLVSRGASLNDVDDLLQDTFAIVWQKQARIDDGKTRQYLVATARHVLLNHTRKCVFRSMTLAAKAQAIASILIPREALPKTQSALYSFKKNKQEIETILEKLPKKYSTTIRLVYLEELTHTEAARHLGVSRETLHRWKREALQKLRALLAEY
jgi:RNA polymerase sigma factor (sigma-70 family)